MNLEIINKPISESACKVLATLWTYAPFSFGATSEGPLFILGYPEKEFMSRLVGLSIKRINNILTELVVTRMLIRVQPNLYLLRKGIITYEYGKREIIIHSNYVFKLPEKGEK